MTHPIQHIGNTILLVMMDVKEGHEAEFDRWYKSQRARPSWIRAEAEKYITQRARGLYKQIYPLEGAFEDHSGSYPKPVATRPA